MYLQCNNPIRKVSRHFWYWKTPTHRQPAAEGNHHVRSESQCPEDWLARWCIEWLAQIPPPGPVLGSSIVCGLVLYGMGEQKVTIVCAQRADDQNLTWSLAEMSTWTPRRGRGFKKRNNVKNLWREDTSYQRDVGCEPCCGVVVRSGWCPLLRR